MIAFILNSRTGNDNEGDQKSGCLEEQGGRRASGCGVCLGRGSRNLSGEMKVLWALIQDVDYTGAHTA